MCLTTGAINAQGSGYLAVTDPPTVAVKRGASVDVKIPATVMTGYHINSNTPSEEYLIPLKITWTATGALAGGAVTYPKPSLEKYEFTEKPLSVYTGNFEMVAHFQVAPRATAGPGEAVGKLRYQACSSRACYPPKTIEVRVPYQVQ